MTAPKRAGRGAGVADEARAALAREQAALRRIAVLEDELMATAISNAEARDEARRLADEQAALRRVATLVAHQPSPAEVFARVAEEVGLLIGVEVVGLIRYEPDGSGTFVARWGALSDTIPIGMNKPVDGDGVAALVRETGRPARVDDYERTTGAMAAYVRGIGLRSAVGTPVVVDGGTWGVLIAGSVTRRLPEGEESRLVDFTELVATAISNIEARSALAASRARIVVATDEARKRVERDLHDGAQQRLVSIALELRELEAMRPDEVRERLPQVGDGITVVLDELRELSRGIHPAILSEAGLRSALRALVRRSAAPIRLDAELEGRLDERVEVAGYYVVSELLANVAKHAEATEAEVEVAVRGRALAIVVADDGVGGADPTHGSGLMGLKDRVEALGGSMTIASRADEGTEVRVELPLDIDTAASRG